MGSCINLDTDPCDWTIVGGKLHVGSHAMACEVFGSLLGAVVARVWVMCRSP